jgi:hypothetical protein
MNKDKYITPEEYLIAEKNGISKKALEQRIRRYGWDKERALTTPIMKREHELAHLAEQNGIPRRVFYMRLYRGWSVERASTEPLTTVVERIKRANEARKIKRLGDHSCNTTDR